MKAFVCVLMFYSLMAFSASKKDAPSHREEKAHQHGSAQVEIAFQGNNGEISIHAAAEGIYGFEYLPKSEADKQKQHHAFALMETNIANMIVFEQDIKCEFLKKSIESIQEPGEKHADFEAVFQVTCQKSPVDSSVEFNFQKTFPKLKSVKVDVIADDLQKSFKANKDGSKLILKK